MNAESENAAVQAAEFAALQTGFAEARAALGELRVERDHRMSGVLPWSSKVLEMGKVLEEGTAQLANIEVAIKALDPSNRAWARALLAIEERDAVLARIDQELGELIADVRLADGLGRFIEQKAKPLPSVAEALAAVLVREGVLPKAALPGRFAGLTDPAKIPGAVDDARLAHAELRAAAPSAARELVKGGLR